MDFVDLVDYVHELLALLLGELGLVELVELLDVERHVVVDAGNVAGEDPVEVGHYQVLLMEVPAKVEDEVLGREDGLHEVDEDIHLLNNPSKVLW